MSLSYFTGGPCVHLTSSLYLTVVWCEADWPQCLSLCSEGQSAAIPVASMEFAAICLRNALLLLPEHQQQELKTENSSKNSSQSGSTESGSENSDACRSDTPVHHTYLLQKDSDAFLTRWFQTVFLFFHKVSCLFCIPNISPVNMFKTVQSHIICVYCWI